MTKRRDGGDSVYRRDQSFRFRSGETSQQDRALGQPLGCFARLVTGEDKALWWERAVAAYPDYAEYQRKTTREIPVFVLEVAED